MSCCLNYCCKIRTRVRSVSCHAIWVVIMRQGQGRERARMCWYHCEVRTREGEGVMRERERACLHRHCEMRMRKRERTCWHPCCTVIMVTVVVTCGGKGVRSIIIIIVRWASKCMSMRAYTDIIVCIQLHAWTRTDAGGTICTATWGGMWYSHVPVDIAYLISCENIWKLRVMTLWVALLTYEFALGGWKDKCLHYRLYWVLPQTWPFMTSAIYIVSVVN